MITELWRKGAQIGIHDGLEEREQIKVRMMNQLAMITMITDLLLLVVRNALGDHFFLRTFVTISFVFVSLYLNHKRLYNLTRHLACMLFPIWVGIIVMFYEGQSGEGYIFILCFILAFIQYEGQFFFKTLSIFLIVIVSLVSGIYAIEFTPEISKQSTPYSTLILFAASVIIVGFILTFYQTDILKFQKQKDNFVKRLKNKNTELERFAYITSHDLKEPVRNIGSFAGLIKWKIQNKKFNPSTDSELLVEIESAATRMSSMIESILKFSKLDQEELSKEEVDLDDIINQIKESHRQLLNNKNVRLNHGDLPVLFGNRIFLSLLFQNLIENAIRYNESSRPEIKIDSKLKDEKIEITISDNGIGIEEKYKEYIFEPFRRIHNRSKYEGSGLGLSICKKIVESHSGEIEVESELGKGSKFHISLPINPN